jgi:predicted HTH domain antitoxin
MEITFNIPDELARQVTSEGKDPARVALEALAIEGYRSELLSESAVRQMLGFETRMEVHDFLKQHGAYLHYDVSDLEQDRVTAQKLRERFQDESASGKNRLG